jgi:hypothetical protein
MKNYQAVNDDVDLAIGTFNRLRHRVDTLEIENPNPIVRNDTISNHYIESLNRLRDCYESMLKDSDKKTLII